MSQTGEGGETALRLEYDGDVAIINAAGDLIGPSNRIESAMTEILEHSYRLVIIDFSESIKIDAEAIGDLAVAHGMASDQEARVVVVLRIAEPYPGEFYPTNLDRVFEFHDTREDALAALRAEVPSVSPRSRTTGCLLLVGVPLSLGFYLLRALH